MIIHQKNTLRKMEMDLDLLNYSELSEEEKENIKRMLDNGEELPEGIYRDENGFLDFYSLEKTQLTDAEKQEYIMLKQYEMLKSIRKQEYILFQQTEILKAIKNILVFFAILGAVSGFIAFIGLFI